MQYIQRVIENHHYKTASRGKSILLLGAQQTGKNNVVKHLGLAGISYTLLDPELRLHFEKIA